MVEANERPQILLILWPAAAERQPKRYLAYSEKEKTALRTTVRQNQALLELYYALKASGR